MLKRRSLLAAGALSSVAGAQTAAGLRIGGFEIAPLVMTGPVVGKPLVGLLPEYLQRHVEPALPFALHWQPLVSFGRALRGLRDGSLDMLMLMGTDRHPGAGLRPFGWTVLQAQPHLAVAPDSPLTEVLRLEQLAGLRIGWIAHSGLPAGMESLPVRWVRVSTAHWQRVSLRMLLAGRLDAVYFANPYSPRYHARQLGLPLRLLRLPLPPRSLSIVHTEQADAAHIASFERIAAPWFAEGRFERTLADYR